MISKMNSICARDVILLLDFTHNLLDQIRQHVREAGATVQGTRKKIE